jgi:hypothetical protein
MKIEIVVVWIVTLYSLVESGGNDVSELRTLFRSVEELQAGIINIQQM